LPFHDEIGKFRGRENGTQVHLSVSTNAVSLSPLETKLRPDRVLVARHLTPTH